MRQVCRQVSPCLPHNYKDSALPAFVFIFSVENNSGKELKVGVTLCFKNGTGSKRDRAGGAWTEPFTEGSVRGVLIHQDIRGLPVTYCVGARQTETSHVSWCGAWDPRGAGDQVWQPLLGAGLLDSAGTVQHCLRAQVGQRSGGDIHC